MPLSKPKQDNELHNTYSTDNNRADVRNLFDRDRGPLRGSRWKEGGDKKSPVEGVKATQKLLERLRP